MPNWTAHQDCRSYRNTGIFTGQNPDQYGNQNAWAIYEDGRRILTLEEADQYTTQAQVDARARLIEAAPELLTALKAFADYIHSLREKGKTDFNYWTLAKLDNNAQDILAKIKDQS